MVILNIDTTAAVKKRAEICITIIIIDLTTLSKNPGVEQPVSFHVSEK